MIMMFIMGYFRNSSITNLTNIPILIHIYKFLLVITLIFERLPLLKNREGKI